jgi:hypothetical protein
MDYWHAVLTPAHTKNGSLCPEMCKILTTSTSLFAIKSFSVWELLEYRTV